MPAKRRSTTSARTPSPKVKWAPRVVTNRTESNPLARWMTYKRAAFFFLFLPLFDALVWTNMDSATVCSLHLYSPPIYLFISYLLSEPGSGVDDVLAVFLLFRSATEFCGLFPGTALSIVYMQVDWLFGKELVCRWDTVNNLSFFLFTIQPYVVFAL